MSPEDPISMHAINRDRSQPMQDLIFVLICGAGLVLLALMAWVL
jgi:hypothetical protein